MVYDGYRDNLRLSVWEYAVYYHIISAWIKVRQIYVMHFDIFSVYRTEIYIGTDHYFLLGGGAI